MNTFIVEVGSPEDRDQLRVFGKIGNPKSLDTLYILETEFSKETIENAASVVAVYEDEEIEPDNLKEDESGCWSLSYMSDAPSGKYMYRRKGDGVHIYVMDSGINKDHPRLRNATLGETVYSFDGQKYDLGQEKAPAHGTDVAACIAGVDDRGRTIGTAPKAKLLNCRYSYRTADAIKCFDTILDHHRNSPRKTAVLNMSFSSYSNKYETALNNLSEEGIVCVASAGNTGAAEARYPAAASRVISTGAITADETLADFSTHGDTVDILAPGKNVKAAYSDHANGTSFSAPYVAGIAALHLQGDLGTEEVKKRLFDGAYNDRIQLASDQSTTVNRVVSLVGGFQREKDKKGDWKKTAIIGVFVAILTAMVYFGSK